MTATSYAEQARYKKAADAQARGIDDALISELVEGFYTRVRDHPVLGPIFASKVENWTPHLERMKDFWASIAIESGRFRGNPMLKHITIAGLLPAHFQIWLGLWDEAVADAVSNPEAASLFRDRAQRIAASLQTGIALHNGGLAALTKEKSHVNGD
ncbi:group III truncated hemoglobin [Sphingorhabdus sp.]|uniref:group III truncated hemoglobin n=1 Tax=Sphingorhabdus sp. TaxID=1902408 RepID=UPI0035937435